MNGVGLRKKESDVTTETIFGANLQDYILCKVKISINLIFQEKNL